MMANEQKWDFKAYQSHIWTKAKKKNGWITKFDFMECADIPIIQLFSTTENIWGVG